MASLMKINLITVSGGVLKTTELTKFEGLLSLDTAGIEVVAFEIATALWASQ